MPVVTATNITKTFQEGRIAVPVLKGISLQVAPGEIVILEGPSGSGKTTLLSILGCILTPSSGRVEIDGRILRPTRASELAEVRRRSIGFVFQQFNLFGALTAAENVSYALNIKGIRGAAADRQARELLTAVGLGDRMEFKPRDLSGGQKQRVAIARALAGNPSLLLADEPTANLDSEVGGQILDLFRDLAKRDDRALIIVTHDTRIRRIADRVLSIQDGQLAA